MSRLTLQDLREVVITDPAVDDCIIWDGEWWRNGPPPGVGGGGLTTEEAQDAIGTILVDSTTIDFTYLDGVPSISGDVKTGSINTGHLSFDVATQTELDTGLATKANTSHTHAVGDITTDLATQTELDTGLATKANTSHTHAVGDITTDLATQAELDTALALKANLATAVMDGDTAGGVLAGTYPSPSFAVDMATQTELDTGLGTKADTVHVHAAADITSGTIATARLGSGTANATTFLRGDQSWATPAGGGSTLPTTIIIIDEEPTVFGDGTTDDSGAIQDLIDTAPGTNDGSVLELWFSDKAYLLDTGLTINNQAVILQGIRGVGSNGGIMGTRFKAGTAGMTMLTMGDAVSTNFHSGPMLRNIGFENEDGLTGVTAIFQNCTLRGVMENVWFAYVDTGVRFNDDGGAGGFDHAWHFWNNLRFFKIGLYGPSTGGYAAIDLGTSNGIMANGIEFNVAQPSVSGLNYAILANTLVGSVGTSSHQFSNLFMDGGGATSRTTAIYLKYARFCHFSNIKCELFGTAFHFDGSYGVSGSFGRGNSVTHAGVAACTNGVVIETAAGHSTNIDGGYINDITYEFGVTNKRTASPPFGFQIGIEINADDAIPFKRAKLGTGTSDATKYLRGDSTWQTLNADSLSDVVITGHAKGDILVSNGTSFVDLTVGTNGFPLQANSADTNGIGWATRAFSFNNQNAVSFGQVALGTATVTTGAALTVNRTETGIGAVGRYNIFGQDLMTYSAGGSYTGLYMAPTVNPNGVGVTLSSVKGLYFFPSIIGAGSITEYSGIQCDVYGENGGTVATARGLNLLVASGGGTWTLGVGIEIDGEEFGGTFTAFTGIRVRSGWQGGTAIGTVIGLLIDSLNGTTTWGMQLGDYQSYHHGKLSLGGTTAPVYGLDLIGTAQDRGVIAFTETASTPTNPSASGTRVLQYMKADKLVWAFKDGGGTMRYFYVDLTQTAAQQVQYSASAP